MQVRFLGLERSPGEGNGNPLQYCCLENSTDRGALWARIHEAAKSQTWQHTRTMSYMKCLYCTAQSAQSKSRAGIVNLKNSPSGLWEILLKVSATLCLIQVLDKMRLHSQAEELRKTKLMEDKNSSIMSLILSFLCLLTLCDFNFLFFFASSPYHCLFKGTNITNSFPLMSKRLTDLSVFSTL